VTNAQHIPNRSRSQEPAYGSTVFLDYSAYMAFMNPEDPCHWKARSLFFSMDDLGRRFTTTNYVLFDVHKWIRNNCDYNVAHHFFQIIDAAVTVGRLYVLYGEEELEKEAKQFLQECPNVQLSLVEAVSVVAMLRHGISQIFTFNSRMLFLKKLNPDIKLIPTQA
jgi:predicted nucleic acid-binding protein